MYIYIYIYIYNLRLPLFWESGRSIVDWNTRYNSCAFFLSFLLSLLNVNCVTLPRKYLTEISQFSRSFRAIRSKAENLPEQIADISGRDSSTLGYHPYRKSGRRHKCHMRHTHSPGIPVSMRREFAVKRIPSLFERIIVHYIVRISCEEKRFDFFVNRFAWCE